MSDYFRDEEGITNAVSLHEGVLYWMTLGGGKRSHFTDERNHLAYISESFHNICSQKPYYWPGSSGGGGGGSCGSCGSSGSSGGGGGGGSADHGLVVSHIKRT
eukprot:6133437-Amphidinium_carterae.4